MVSFIPLKEKPSPGQCLIFAEMILSAITNGTKITVNYYIYKGLYLYSLSLNSWSSNQIVDYFLKHHTSCRDFIFILRLGM